MSKTNCKETGICRLSGDLLCKSESHDVLSVAPDFVEAIRIMAHDNNMALKPLDSWPEFINYKLMQEQASSFTKEELEIFVAGEISEMNALAKKNKCEMLHMVLNEIFDGALYDFFCIT